MAVLLSLIFTLVLLVLGFMLFCIPSGLMWLVLDRFALSRLNRGVRFALPLVLLPLAYVVLTICLFFWFTRPAAVYEMAFGFPPTSDVSIISSSHSGIGDFGEHRLTFTASKQTINRILLRQFETRLEDSDPENDGFYHFEREYSETFASETSKLIYNPESRRAQYHWQGID